MSASPNLVAVPSEAPGGLDAPRSEHFGHCDCFTLVDVNDGVMGDVAVVANREHGGNCIAPIHLLVTQGVATILVHGIGMRPLIGFRQSGIEVLRVEGETVRACLERFTEGRVERFADQHACGGGHGHGGGGCRGHGPH
jgi:predicted Fe-Mo cluster-binding NifX family protein